MFLTVNLLKNIVIKLEKKESIYFLNLAANENRWKPMEIHRNLWKSIEVDGNRWKCMEIH